MFIAKALGLVSKITSKVDENKKKDIDINLDNLYDEPSK
tara:strand:- start:1134 stop:1250 length:117 start_codon:yes stop_codon:yes gene_type:complete